MENKNRITPMNVAEVLEVKDKFLDVLTEQELKKEYIQKALKETEEHFFNSDPVEIPK